MATLKYKNSSGTWVPIPAIVAPGGTGHCYYAAGTVKANNVGLCQIPLPNFTPQVVVLYRILEGTGFSTNERGYGGVILTAINIGNNKFISVNLRSDSSSIVMANSSYDNNWLSGHEGPVRISGNYLNFYLDRHDNATGYSLETPEGKTTFIANATNVDYNYAIYGS